MHLSRAREAAETEPQPGWRRDLGWTENVLVESALGHLDAAEATKFRLVGLEALRAKMPSIEAQVYRYLPKDDPRRRRVEELAFEAKTRAFTDADREPLLAAFHAAASQRHREVTRLGSFFVVLVRATVCVALLAIALMGVGALFPTAVPLCFHPEDKGLVVCPTEQTPAAEDGAPKDMPQGDVDDAYARTVSRVDYLVVGLAGLLAAAIAGIGTLRRMRGTSTPYRVPIAVALFKLPAGAVTAVVGLILMRGGFVPGLTALDSSAQIIAWAMLFGYAQQLVTGLIDQRAHGVLEDVGGRGASGERPLAGTD